MAYLKTNYNQKIAFKANKGKSPTIIFIHGLNSDMEGLKSINLHKFTKKNNLNYVRFDCRGHGKSFGKFEEFTITDWKNDLINVIDNLTKGPIILVGSSMGGWLMFLAAKARSKRIIGLIGLAAAVDFGNDLFKNLTKKNKNELNKNKITQYKSYGFSYPLTKKFFIEANKNNILTKTFKFSKPIILIHGMKDKVVNIEMPKKILNCIKSENSQIIYLQSSDHRLSKKEDLVIINSAINNILLLV